MVHLLKTKKELKNLKTDEIQNISTKTQSGKVFEDKAFEIASNPSYDGYQKGLASMLYKFFGKKTSGRAIKNEIKQNEQLAKELHKTIIRKF